MRLKSKNEKRSIKQFRTEFQVKWFPIRGINDHVLIPHSYYLGVYQYEATKRDLHKEVNSLFGLEPNQNKWQNGDAQASINIGVFKISHWFFESVLGAVGYLKNPNIYGKCAP